MIGVVADDLTGAAEIGAVGLRHGLRAEVILAGAPGDDEDLICVDTDSRSCDPTGAARRATNAARMLQNCGADWIYKKTDSVLRGNVTPEIEAIVEQLGLSGALLVPANPSFGRTVVNGQYFVNGQLIHQTEFARDPKHPRLSPNVLELLDKPLGLPISVGKFSGLLPERGIVVGEVASAEDVRAWAKLRNEQWLMAGGAEFFGALLTTATPIPQSRNAPGKEMFICGSASEATHKFVAGQAQHGVPVFSLPDKLAAVGAFDATAVDALAARIIFALQVEPRVILHVGLPQVKDISLAEMLATHLVRVAAEVLRLAPVGQVFAEGGATAVGLAQEMGWQRLAVKSELAPGVVTLSVIDGGAPLLTIKPGSYAWPESLIARRRDYEAINT
jgi:D-threonate/D-erythronate kinase